MVASLRRRLALVSTGVHYRIVRLRKILIMIACTLSSLLKSVALRVPRRIQRALPNILKDSAANPSPLPVTAVLPMHVVHRPPTIHVGVHRRPALPLAHLRWIEPVTRAIRLARRPRNTVDLAAVHHLWRVVEALLDPVAALWEVGVVVALILLYLLVWHGRRPVVAQGEVEVALEAGALIGADSG